MSRPVPFRASPPACGPLAGFHPARPVSRRGLLAIAAALLAAPAAAQDDPDPRLAAAAGSGALAYVLTGDAAVDEASMRGLSGLSEELTRRTTVEPGTPVGVTPGQDDLTLLTFLYWPVTPDQPLPSVQGYAALNRFLQTGGMILLDTRDADIAGLGGPDGSADLQRLAAGLDIPPLAQVPPDHVLTRSFYLLDSFPGRFSGGAVWVEAPAQDDAQGAGLAPANDGVSRVVIGGNDWAAAWAATDQGLAAYAIGGGQDAPYDPERQRELALRFGINLVMYALSGNYKSDQVHVRELLDRLGRERGGGSAAPPEVRP